MRPPIFLEDYDVFGRLGDWFAVNRPTERRHWILKPYGKSFECGLTWNMGGQCAALAKLAPTPQEAVYLALDAFQEWEAARLVVQEIITND